MRPTYQRRSHRRSSRWRPQTASPETVGMLRDIIAADRDVAEVARVMTMQLGSRSIMLAVDLQFRAGLSSDEVARTVDRIQKRER